MDDATEISSMRVAKTDAGALCDRIELKLTQPPSNLMPGDMIVLHLARGGNIKLFVHAVALDHIEIDCRIPPSDTLRFRLMPLDRLSYRLEMQPHHLEVHPEWRSGER